jgi:tetratricopeptide (TPR) repeat protein
MTTFTEQLYQGYQQHLSGNFFLAEMAYQKALEFDPDSDEALNMLAVVCSRLGRTDEALNFYERAQRVCHAKAEFYLQLGMRYQAEAIPELALHAFREAYRLNPKAPLIYANLGGQLNSLRFYQEALLVLEQGCHFFPHSVEVLFNLGNACHNNGLHDRAIDIFESVLDLNPEMYLAKINIGNVLSHKGYYKEALAVYKEVIDANPANPLPYNNYGFTLQAMSQVDKAVEYYHKAISMKPDYYDAIWNLTLAYLIKGDFINGWKGYEDRYTHHEFSIHRYHSKPRWKGEMALDKRLLIIGEQGHGDSFQFLRFFPEIRKRCKELVFECAPHMMALLENSAYVDKVVERNNFVEPDNSLYDMDVFMMSIPHYLGSTIDTMPPLTKDLIVHRPEMLAKWETRIAADKADFKIGFVWFGNPENPRNVLRSARLDLFVSLMDLPEDLNVKFFSVQLGQDEELAKYSHIENLVSLAPELESFSDTAAAIEQFDMMITSDTAVAHLSAVLLKPIWLVLPYAADWRWMEHRSDSPWYPNMKLYRQQKPREWDYVFDNVRADLAPYIRSQLAAKGKQLVSSS